MTYYKQHVFFCTNQREGKQCCQDAGAKEMRDYAKSRIKALGISGKNQIRVSAAGCMGRCAEGPVLVIYPEGVWYTYRSTTDIDEIIAKHLLQGEVVTRLLLDKNGSEPLI